MTAGSVTARIDGLFFGKVAHRCDGLSPSAIDKTLVTGRQEIDELGFTKDAQADPEHHGGPDKAIHHYPTDHYDNWIAEGEIPAGTVPAAFGENIATIGLTEVTLCIGDIFRLGTATVQISQGRQPCWKVSRHTGNSKMAYLFQKTGRTGWYYRVLEPGSAGTGDMISLLERPQPDWSVRRVTAARLTREVSLEEAATLANMAVLANGWRKAFAKMSGGDFEEDTSRRLQG
jgi:MOSC domain-containing protein YiiM